MELDIPKNEQVEIILRTETDELGIPAGYNDRVAQVYEGLTFYKLDTKNQLHVESLNPKVLPPLFVAINQSSSEGTEVYHSNLSTRFQSDDPVVLDGIKQQSELTRKCRNLLKLGKGNEIGPLLNDNFNIRKNLIKLNPKHEEMVEIARKAGAYAKFAGSGGTIVGTCHPNDMDKVLESLRNHCFTAFQPQIKESEA